MNIVCGQGKQEPNQLIKFECHFNLITEQI